MVTPVLRSGRYPKAHRPFFLAAGLYAAAAVPLWWGEWAGLLPGCAGCDPVARHAHEMLLGFAGAVLAGYLFTKVTMPRLACALSAWLAARIGAWAAIGGWEGAALSLAFPVLLFAFGGWPFLRAAKLGHNMVFAPTIAGFAVAEALYQAGRLGLVEAGERRGVLTALDLLALMMLVMGGRVIPAAMAGMVRKAESAQLFDRNRPWLEWAVIAGAASQALAHALGYAHLPLAVIAGVAALARQRRWRMGLGLTDPSMGPVQLGHALLASGLIVTALADLLGPGVAGHALHMVTIGGMGLIAATMMLRIDHIRERRGAGWPRVGVGVAAMLVAAMAVRLVAPVDMATLVSASAGLWALGFVVLTAALIRGWISRPPA